MNRWTFALVVAGIAASPSFAQQVSSISPATVPASATTAATALVDVPIGALDSIAIQVFGVPELSQTVRVDSAGFIELPLLGRMSAVGQTTNQLAHKITVELEKKYVRDPMVTVTVNDAASQKVTVDGEVSKPGMYEIQAHTTLMQAVALANGPTTVADIHHVAIMRMGASGRAVSVYDLQDIRDGKQVDPPVQANDEVVVDSSGSRKFVRDFGSLFGLIGALRP